MDFFQGQETLTALQWILRGVISYFFLLTVARVLGQRTIDQLRLLDFVIALVIGNVIAQPLSDERLGMKGSIITTLVLVVLYIISLFGILKFPSLRKLLNSSPIIVVKDGEILHKSLKKARISIDILLEELREEKVIDVKNVALAIWEADGKLSVFLDPKYEPITPDFYKLQAAPLDFPRTIVKEGKIISEELKEINKDDKWLVSIIKSSYNTELKNVLLATIDSKKNVKVFLYK